MLGRILFIITLLLTPFVSAQESSGTGSVTITVEQTSPYADQEVYGLWTLSTPSTQRLTQRDRTQTVKNIPAGHYIFGVENPSATKAHIELRVKGELRQTVDIPQLSFDLVPGDNATITITYAFTRTGIVSVQSTPPGLSFTLRGPDETEFAGLTPASFENAAEGLYTVYFEEIEGCITPPAMSDRLVKDGRIALSVEITCRNLSDLPQAQEEERKLSYVTVTVDGTLLSFEDTPIDAWFSPFIAMVAKAGIITGYRDLEGNTTGRFGPEDPVTIAQLAKIAHEIANIDAVHAGVPRNSRARGTWFAKYVASAEKQYWRVFLMERLDPSRRATRAEVVATILQALDVPRIWPRGELFRDVTPLHPYADVIETAAKDGMIAGYTNFKGEALGIFGPDNPVNRAEMAKIVANAMDLYLEDTAEIQPEG